MSNPKTPSPAGDLSLLQARVEAMIRGDFSGLGTPLSADDDIERLRRALDVIGAHLQQAHANADDYIAGLIRNQEAERQRLSRDLHDDVVQRLIALGQGLDRLEQNAGAHDADEIQAGLGTMRQDVNQLVRTLREVIADLHPPILDEMGLIPALRMLFSRAGTGDPHVFFEVAGEAHPLSAAAMLAVYRIAQEAWSNIQRHAQAGAVWVSLVFAEPALRITIRDDGVGFVPEASEHRTGRREGGWGLSNMRERAALAGGGLHLISVPAEGTTVFVHMPYAKDLMRDPVCGMKIGTDAPSVVHAGMRYYFCSEACKALFESQPDTFITPAT
jgi:signal transduction histidine kinase/YHS domain-containing protein